MAWFRKRHSDDNKAVLTEKVRDDARSIVAEIRANLDKLDKVLGEEADVSETERLHAVHFPGTPRERPDSTATA